jgi:glycosyltransferase involved in cell wall biosynthesis
MRFLQYLPLLRQAGLMVTVQSLISDEMLASRYQRGSYGVWRLFCAYVDRIRALIGCSRFDLVWIEKEALPWFPAGFERMLLRKTPYVLDFDDAVFHNYDLHRLALVRALFGRRLDKLMSEARVVVAGNRYLADRANQAGAQQVSVIPTVVDLQRYSAKVQYEAHAGLRIVWVGSPSTVKYLSELKAPLGELAKRIPYTLHVIGGEFVMEGVHFQNIAWSAEAEAGAIAECDIGIMPLADTPWEQGKCAYKLIQYMACGLPTVATPIGANRDVVVDGETGYFANTPSEWVDKLERLLSDASLRAQLGRAGRARVAALYCLQQVAPLLETTLAEASGGGR